jgi:hypothetical protein
MALGEATDGFLLAEVPLGTGILDLGRMVKTIRESRPNTKLTLEMITRDPLRVPAMTDSYWAAFPERTGVPLARTLRLVRETRRQLATYSKLPAQEQLRREEDNVRRCLTFDI